MPSETVTIETKAGHSLSGSLELPAGLLRGVALFAHCFTCTKASKAAVSVTRALAREGIACLRFDFTGLGGSEGDFGRAGYATDVADLACAAEYLLDRFGDGILLVGHSLGGAAVLSAAREIGAKRVAAIATIGAPSDVAHVLLSIKGDIDEIRSEGEGEVNIGGRNFALSRDFVKRAEEAQLLEDVKALRLPLMFLHSPTDAIVGIEHAGSLFEAAKHPKSFVSLFGADHLLLDQRDADFAAGVIAGWAARYLPMKEDWPMPQEGVVVKTGHGKFGTEVHTRSHRFVADEPRSYGGDDLGPTPYDLLLAGLGSCTAMTMKMYADRKGYALEGASVSLIHERDHAEDLGHVDDGKMKVQAIHRRISLSGELTSEEREKIIEIADKCPVHRTLEGHLHIHTEAD